MGEDSKLLENQGVEEPKSYGSPKCVPSERENVTVSSQQGASDTVTKPTEPTDETRLVVLAGP